MELATGLAKGIENGANCRTHHICEDQIWYCTTVSRQRNVVLPDLFLVLFLLDSSPVEPVKHTMWANELLFPGVHYVLLQPASNRVSFAYLVFRERFVNPSALIPQVSLYNVF